MKKLLSITKKIKICNCNFWRIIKTIRKRKKELKKNGKKSNKKK
jgi:hypothetical protein